MKKLLISFFILCIFLFQQTLIGQCDKDLILGKQKSASKNFKKFNINNISTFVQNNGTADVYGFNAGFQFPKGSNKYAFYSSGILIGCRKADSIAICGSNYSSNLKPGKWHDNSVCESWDSVLVYRTRPDFRTCGLQDEIKDELKTYEELFDDYENDWMNWPAADGAPFEDINSNGVYEPEIDIPGVPGAQQTLWYVASAGDPVYSHIVFLSPAADLEIQVTIWGYNDGTYLDNIMFKKIRIINKGNIPLTDMYLSVFVDSDIGGAADDYAGCDTSLNLGYAYNSDPEDIDYGTNPPAVGLCFLKGAESSFGENKGMTSFVYWRCGGTYEIVCPDLDAYDTGALIMYNLMQGRTVNGEYISIPDELGGGKTCFRGSGDPVTGTGWIDGVFDYPTGDRTFIMSTGPTNLEPDEEQEIIFAQLAAGGVQGIDHLQAVTELKALAHQLQADYGMISDMESSEEIPSDFKLLQNYPNPFNPSTKIIYSVPLASKIRITVYDMLGREINKLVDEYKSPGTYEVDFNASNLPSGVYFYELQTGDLGHRRKMVLLK